MSFFSELGGFISQVQQVSDFTNEIKQGIVSNVKDAVVAVESQGSEITSQAQSVSDAVEKTTQDISSDVQSTLK